MTWASFLITLIGPLAVRVMLALGFSAITFTGVVVASNTLIGYAQDYWSSVPLTVLQLASLSGIPEFFGMLFGALVARVSMWAVVSASRYVFSPA